MKTPPSASASPKTPSAVMRALADEFAELAAAATPGTRWYTSLPSHNVSAEGKIVAGRYVEADYYVAKVSGLENAEANAAFIAWCGTHRAIIASALRAVADSAEEALRCRSARLDRPAKGKETNA